MLKVAVGSLNPVKIRATENVLSKIYGKLTLKILPYKAEADVPKQPLDFETVEGALKRAKISLEATRADLGVGIEAGLFSFPHISSGYMAFQCCIVTDTLGRVTAGCSSGFELPAKVVNMILTQKKELEEVIDKLAGKSGSGLKTGAAGFFSKGMVTRLKLTEQAVLAAVIPRISEKEYFTVS